MRDSGSFRILLTNCSRSNPLSFRGSGVKTVMFTREMVRLEIKQDDLRLADDFVRASFWHGRQQTQQSEVRQPIYDRPSSTRQSFVKTVHPRGTWLPQQASGGEFTRTFHHCERKAVIFKNRRPSIVGSKSYQDLLVTMRSTQKKNSNISWVLLSYYSPNHRCHVITSLAYVICCPVTRLTITRA